MIGLGYMCLTPLT